MRISFVFHLFFLCIMSSGHIENDFLNATKVFTGTFFLHFRCSIILMFILSTSSNFECVTAIESFWCCFGHQIAKIQLLAFLIISEVTTVAALATYVSLHSMSWLIKVSWGLIIQNFPCNNVPCFSYSSSYILLTCSFGKKNIPWISA